MAAAIRFFRYSLFLLCRNFRFGFRLFRVRRSGFAFGQGLGFAVGQRFRRFRGVKLDHGCLSREELGARFSVRHRHGGEKAGNAVQQEAERRESGKINPENPQN